MKVTWPSPTDGKTSQTQLSILKWLAYFTHNATASLGSPACFCGSQNKHLGILGFMMHVIPCVVQSSTEMFAQLPRHAFWNRPWSVAKRGKLYGCDIDVPASVKPRCTIHFCPWLYMGATWCLLCPVLQTRATRWFLVPFFFVCLWGAWCILFPVLLGVDNTHTVLCLCLMSYVLFLLCTSGWRLNRLLFLDGDSIRHLYPWELIYYIIRIDSRYLRGPHHLRLLDLHRSRFLLPWPMAWFIVITQSSTVKCTGTGWLLVPAYPVDLH